MKWTLRQEIPGYEEFEKTGKFPEGLSSVAAVESHFASLTVVKVRAP